MPNHLSRLAVSLGRTRRSLVGRLANVLGAGEISETTWDELEATLLQADLGVASSMQVVANLRRYARDVGMTKCSDLQSRLREELGAI